MNTYTFILKLLSIRVKHPRFSLKNVFLVPPQLSLNNSRRQKQSQNSILDENGFTLIELLVVVIILGILSAMTLPALINQVGKAREADTLATLGALSRSQQGYHWENGRFASDISMLTGGGGSNLRSKNHEILEDITQINVVTYTAELIDPEQKARDLALGVYYNASDFSYSVSICRGANIGDDVAVGNTADADCTNGGTKIR